MMLDTGAHRPHSQRTNEIKNIQKCKRRLRILRRGRGGNARIRLRGFLAVSQAIATSGRKARSSRPRFVTSQRPFSCLAPITAMLLLFGVYSLVYAHWTWLSIFDPTWNWSKIFSDEPVRGA